MRKAVKTRDVYHIKRASKSNVTNYKARLVAQGFKHVPGRDSDETWSPVPGSATTRALFAVAASKDWEVHHVDVRTAFSNSKMDKKMYTKLPDGSELGEADEVFRLNLALYGTKQAGRLWGIKLDKELKAMGAVRSKVDPCLHTWSHPVHGLFDILVYVEDLIVAGKSLDGVQAVKNSVSVTFDVRDVGEVKDFIGMKQMRDRAAKLHTLSNPGHVIVLLEAIGMSSSTPNKTPMVSGAKLAKTAENLLPDGIHYAELVGSLLYLSTTTRPDIAFSVAVLSLYMACPEEDHMRAVNGVLRYLRGATRLGVAYGDDKPLQGAPRRTKHVDVAYHMVRECVARGDVTSYFLPSAEMPADGLTKMLPGPAFRAFRDAPSVGRDLGMAAAALEPDPACSGTSSHSPALGRYRA